jgi:UDP-2,3-diacylglucosamine hydrolase
VAKKHYFFSDVHLGMKSPETEKAKEKKLISFLEQISADAERVFIAGDLFDCWIEYRKVVPKGYFRLLAKLNEMAESGIRLEFLSGNHDFWLNTYLRDEVGLELHDKDVVLEIDRKKFYITHGDGIAKRDRGYRFIKKILRSRVNQFLFSLIHPDIGISLAQMSSRKSRGYNEEKDFGYVQALREFAGKKISEGFDYIITGHIHKPRCEQIKNGYLINLGDWIKNYSYGEFAEGKFELKYWK